MGIFHYAVEFSPITEAFTDSLMLLAVMAPILFFFLYRPIKLYVYGLEDSHRQITYQSQHDTLTDLPNRALFEDRVQQSIYASQRDNEPFVLAIFRLSRIKEINETLGYQVGDLVLKEMAKRLQSEIRKSDTVARLDSAVFGLMFPAVNEELAIVIAEKYLALSKTAITSDELELDIEGHMGIATYPANGDDVKMLIRRAEAAMHIVQAEAKSVHIFNEDETEDTTRRLALFGELMHIAKAEAKSVHIFNEDETEDTTRRLALFGELRRAIDQDNLVLYYQPKICMRTNKIKEVEALVRWDHAEQGLIQPDEFLPLAEKTALIKPLTYWVLNEAIRQCKAWNTDGYEIKININLSPRNLLDTQLAEKVGELLSTWDLDPGWIGLEITENALMHDLKRYALTVNQLDRMGLKFSIDDFGTGYSSLVNLKALPFVELKIDQTFVKNMHHNRDNAAIVESTVTLGHSLGLSITAEGVECEEEWEALRALDCDVAQGYYIGRPLPENDFIGWLKEFRSR